MTDHRLEFLDHAILQMLRATGRRQLMQAVWVYEHPIDRTGLARFHDNLGRSIAHRLIEPSPLPFGRPRWVRPAGPPPPLLVGSPRPRDELLDWADSLGQLPIDPVVGPAWQLVLQPFTDGSTAVSMIGSHAIGDGVGALMAIHEAITGTMRDVPYDTADTRPLRAAIAADVRQAWADRTVTVTAARTAARAIRAARRQREATPAAPTPTARRTTVHLATATALVSPTDWDERARGLSGNSHALLAGIAARLGAAFGRRRPSDGAVTLQMAVNRRTSLADDRAIVMEFAQATVDPTGMEADLGPTRAVLRESRRRLDERPDPVLEMLPLVPWLPLRAMRSAPDMVFSYSDDLPVSCSNLGELPPHIAQADGTPAEHMIVRGVDAHVTLADLERSHGHLVVVAGRIGGDVSISVESWELGADNSRERLRALLDAALADFGLTGTHL